MTNTENLIAILDTETNYDNELISLGIVLADPKTYLPVKGAYWIFFEEWKPSVFAASLRIQQFQGWQAVSHLQGVSEAKSFLEQNNVSKIFAYNAGFDHGHLPELHGWEWYDIMQVAAYKTCNPHIPDHADCYKTGRLKRGYGVESMIRMMHDSEYCETHNAYFDALDELFIMQKIGKPAEEYAHTKIGLKKQKDKEKSQKSRTSLTSRTYKKGNKL